MGQNNKLQLFLIFGLFMFLFTMLFTLPMRSFAAPQAEGEPPVPKTPPPIYHMNNSLSTSAPLSIEENTHQPTPTAQVKFENFFKYSIYDSLMQQIEQHGNIRIIVRLDVPFTPLGNLNETEAQEQISNIQNAQNELKSAINNYNISNLVLFQTIPYAAMDVDAAALEAISKHPLVANIEENTLHEKTLDLSVPRIGANTVWGKGYNGNGITVAVLDTGVQKTHPFLSGKVVSEACFSTTSIMYGTQSICLGGVSQSTAVDSAMPYLSGVCPSGECDHGTHVAGIISGGTGSGLSGVAPGSNLIAIQVFSYIPSMMTVGAWTSDYILGLERVYALRSSYTIAAANMSLGGGLFTNQNECDQNNSAVKAIIDNLRSVKIATIVSAGNNGATNAISRPACISSAVSVGATDDTDQVATYSNSAYFINLLAPGSSINSSIPISSYASWDGTSMAAPHVAGSFALLRQAKPNANVMEILQALNTTGVPIKDNRNNITKPRIQLDQALNYLQGNSSTSETTIRLSISSAGEQANAASFFPSISSDGRTITFHSDASNLVQNDTNNKRDVFVRDTTTSTTTRVSVSSLSSQADGSSEYASISADGQMIAFHSSATNLVENDTNGVTDIFVHNRNNGTTIRVSVAYDGSQANMPSYFPAISGNGRYVSFYSYASNLVANDTNNKTDIFVHDLQTSETTRINLSSSGSQANDNSFISKMSYDGRFVVFDSFASNLVANDTNASSDIFLFDRVNNLLKRVSIASDGSEAYGHSFEPHLSHDGRLIVFDSWAANLVANDTNNQWDVFVHDTHSGETTRVSVGKDGIQANGDSSWYPAISADGRYVAFWSEATNLIEDDANLYADVFMHDRLLKQTRRVSIGNNGEQGNSYAYIYPAISNGGQVVAFESLAWNLVANDTNGVMDVFLHENILTPNQVVLIEPINNTVLSHWHPIFRWYAVEGAVEYQWYLQSLTTQDGSIQQTITPKQAACDYSGICSMSSPQELRQGVYLWRVRAKNHNDYGAWSDDGVFNTPNKPNTVTLISPINVVVSKQPQFVWHHIADATRYTLWVYGKGGAVIRKDIEPVAYQCNSTNHQCKFSSPIFFEKGSYTWWVQALNPSGASHWSARADFSVE